MQRDTAFPIWSRQKATAAFLDKKYEAQPADNKWLIILDPVPAGGPFIMDIVFEDGSSAGRSVRIHDIYSGDVWLAAGQSNMEMPMQRLSDDFPEEWEYNYPLIRQFKAPQEWDFSGPREELSGGSWIASSPDTLHEFSSTAWFFARNLYEKYRIPIGIVHTAWGGTPIEAWMCRESLAGFPAGIADGDQFADAAKCKEITEKTNSAIQEWETRLLREDRGLAEEWQKPSTDISDWKELTLPGDFADARLSRFCGAVWLAVDFNVPADFANQDAKIWLGTIVDADTVYINGTETGSTAYRYPPRKYPLPRGILKEGKNRIVIRVTCNQGVDHDNNDEGGITRDKPFRIFTDNETVELAGTWKYRVGASAPARPEDFFFQRRPMGPYNAMIAPVLKFPLKGVIWYQGESNEKNHTDYASLFRLLIDSWRKKNGNEELPFLFVQLPIFGKPEENNESSPWAVIREAQKAALTLPVTGMAAALDLGEWNDIHPINKKDIGFRLFLAAEKTLFNIDNSSPGPMLRSFRRVRGKLFLTFDNSGAGLCARETPHVSVVTGNELIRLPAKIEGHDVISIDVSSVKNIQKVLYAWAKNPKDRQLYNSEGLPAIPFKIENIQGKENDV